MRCNRWKQKSKRLLDWSSTDMIDFLTFYDNRISPKLAKWIYLNSFRWDDSEKIQILALKRLRFKSETWVRPFLLRELQARKHEPFADWIVVAIGDWMYSKYASLRLFEDEIAFLTNLYEDQTAAPEVRGSTLFALNNYATQMHWKKWGLSRVDLLNTIRETCSKALYDQKNAYARAGACWLGKTLGGFESRLLELKEDHTKTFIGSKVSSYVD